MAKAKIHSHSITKKNVDVFIDRLHSLLQEFDAHLDDSPISLRTSNFNFRAEGIQNCPQACIRKVRSCDLNGKNCRIDVFCDC